MQIYSIKYIQMQTKKIQKDAVKCGFSYSASNNQGRDGMLTLYPLTIYKILQDNHPNLVP